MVLQSGIEIPHELGGVISPGLPILPHGVERYLVPGAGSQAVVIEKGDEITVLNREGLQSVEIVFFTPDGRSDAGMIGAQGKGNALGLQSVLASGDVASQRVLRALDVAGFDISIADAAIVFEQGSRTGELATFKASEDGLLIVCTPGGSMAPECQNPPTEIVLYVHRANPTFHPDILLPPDPLADALVDINIQPGNVISYKVKAGEYIQILDVQGRECSDFQAFSLRALDRGIDREIDPTATRSLTGLLYPTPGIASKFYNVDEEPLVQVVQDTCGRHDTFGLACFARFYEDQGYPGHINCTDNINRELAKYNIRPRSGWPAINFFFNSFLENAHVLAQDEPWSRPGDFVMLKALTDLVCVSTACPNEIDQANGWNPTDIQIRVYEKNEDFKNSIGYRKSVEADMEKTKETGFHHCFARHTRNFVEYSGFWVPHEMTNHGAIAEYWAAREKAVVMDLSPLRKYEVTGPDAEKLMQLCVTRNMKKLAIGQITYTPMCYEHGGMIDDGTVFRLGENNFRWIGGVDASGLWLREQVIKHDLQAWVRDSTSQLCNIAVQGPRSRDILKDLVWAKPTQPTLEELQLFRFSIARLGDFQGPSILVGRAGYTGELGYEIFCHPKDAVQVFDAVWEAGQPHGLIPFGMAALDLVRIEAGLIFAGSEFNDQTDPMEAGIGFAVPLESKQDDFIGRKALERRKAHPSRKLVGLELEGGVVPCPGDCVRVGKAQIGDITSAMKSPYLGKVSALALIDVAYSELATQIEIGKLDGHQKRLKAQVVPYPHFDPTKERVKGNYN